MPTTGGPPFFPEQKRLLEIVLAARALAADAGADLSRWLPDEDMASALGRRRCVMVLGGVNAGKSTLVNALCQAPICPVSKLPDTKSVAIYHEGHPEAITALAPRVRTFRRDDVPVLHDFHFIDTPGTNGLAPDIAVLLIDLAGICDVVLVSLAATNPWEPATWDLLSRLARKDLGKLVIVLQQTDLRPPDDIAVLTGHVADLARKRCGITPPVFPFAAPVTAAAAADHPDCNTIWQHVIQDIRARAGFRDPLTDWKHRAGEALRALDDHIDLSRRNFGAKNRLLDGIEQEIGLMHASFRRQLETRMEELAESFRGGNHQTLRLLKRRLRFLPSLLRLFGRDRTAALMESAFIERLKSSFQDSGKEDAMAILSACRSHARKVDERLRDEQMALPLSEQELETRLSDAEQRFRVKLDQAAGIRLESVRVRNRLAKELRRRNRALNAFTATCLLLLTIGSVAGALGIPWVAYSLCALAFLFLLGALAAASRTTPRVLDGFDRQMSEACGAFAQALLTDYEEALRGVFRDYAETMLPLRSALSRGEASVKPLQKRWQHIFLRLKSLD